MKPLPTIREETSSREPHRAKWWRQRLMKLSVEQLAEMTGYSVEAIYRFERGVTSLGKPHPQKAWQRYRLACAGTLVRFKWGQ